MITEVKRGNWLTRSLFGDGLGFRELYYDPIIPDNLIHPLPQPGEVTLWLRGPKDMLEVDCETPTGTVILSRLAPPGTVFLLDSSKFGNFRSNATKKQIKIPSNLDYLRRYGTAYAILHEEAHLWSHQDKDWATRLKEAKETIGDANFFSRALNGYVWLSHEPDKRQRDLEAWKILGEEERRAAAISLYLYGRLLERGINVFPQLKKTAMIEKMVNGLLKKHEVFKIPLSFTSAEIRDFINGQLHWSEAQRLVSDHFMTMVFEDN